MVDAYLGRTRFWVLIYLSHFIVPLNALFINCVPKDNHRYLTLGYDRRYVSEAQKKMAAKRKSALEKV